jgi:O-antigen/teichoic acid export membrane protein
MSGVGGRVLRSAVWAAAEVWGRHAVMFVVLVVLAHHLGAEAFGLAALAMVAPIILTVPVVYGIPDALVQRAEIEPIHLDSAFWLLAATGLVLSAAIWVSAGPIAAVLNEPLLEPLLHWTSPIVAIQGLAAVPAAVLKRQLEFRLFAIRTMAGTAVGGALGISMAVLDFGVWSLIAMQLAKVTTETTVLVTCSKWRPQLRFSYARCRDLFGFAGPLVVQSLWTIINDELPKILLGALLGVQAVGIYAFARKPLELLSQCFLGPLMAVALPAVSRVQRDAARIDRFFDTTVRMAGMVGFPVFIGFAAIAPEAVPFIFGAHWSEAVLAVQTLMLIGLLRTVDGITGHALLGLGHSRLLLKLNIAYTILIGLLLPIAALINLEMALLALVLCNLGLVPIFLYFAQRVGGIHVMQPLRLFPRLAVAAVAMFVAVTTWRLGAPTSASSLVVIGVGIGIGILAYGVVVVTLIREELAATRDTLLKLRQPGRQVGAEP